MISLKDVSVTLGGRTVLDRACVEVAEGEAVGLVGPNGSGKSTLLRCLLGLVPFTGEARVAGFDVVKQPVQARERLGYLPQRPAFGDVRAREALVFVAALRGIDPARIDPVLAEVGLAADANSPARTFSGGMQQRLALAVALLTSAPALLLDEPTASLDVDGQAAFLEIAALLRRRGRTLLIASHRPEEISRLTDRVLFLDRGRLMDAPTTGKPSGARILALRTGDAR